MATAIKAKKSSKKDIPVRDLSIWWSDLQSLPAEDKNEMWAAMNLYFFKRNAKLFLDQKRTITYRATDSLQPQEGIYKEMVDPTTPMAAGGTAAYFSADWKQEPLYLHLKNIVKAKMQKTGKQLTVNLTDKYAKGKKLEESYRILYRDAFRRVINMYAPEVGIAPISENEDPYEWVKSLTGDGKKGEKNTGKVIDNFVDLIKNKITDSQDLALYSELIYKCDYEAAFELGIDYYLNNLNKWHDRYADRFIDDIMHFNKACGEWHTDLITGRPIVEYLLPENLWVSPFRQKDGEDLMYYFTEYEITFGDFAKTIGKNLSPQKLKEVFLYQKTQGANHGISWIENLNAPNRTMDNANIRVGRAACLSQDIVLSGELPIEYINSVYPSHQEFPSTWSNMEDGSQRIEKYYNVWYSFFYIPPTTNSLSNADFQWQAQFIFDIKKNQDQFRYGEDGRFSKSPLVIIDNSDQASFTDITQSYMPMITHSKHKFQNCLVNDLDAVAISDEFLGGLLAAVDEGNKINPANPNEPTGGNGRDALLEQWKMIQQGGKGFLKMTDKNGQYTFDPSKLILNIKNGYLEKAEHYLLIIAQQYDLMCKAIAQSAATTGEEIAPRTPVAAIEESIKASSESTFFMEKYYNAIVKQYGERMIQYILMMAKEAKTGFTKRWEEFMENVGYANGLAIEGMEDIPPEAVGMTVEYVDTLAMKTFILQLATEYVKTQQLSEEFLFLIMSSENFKMGMLLMRIGIKQRRKEAQQDAAVQQQYAMQLKEKDLEIAMAMQGAKTQGKQAEITTQGEIQNMINKALNDYKYQSQSALKDQTTGNRILETKEKLNTESTLKQQESLQE